MTAQLALFDYATLDSETRIVVQQRTTEIKGLMRRAAQDIIEIGHKLKEVKARLGHGHFGGWLRAEFEWSEPTAQRFMRVSGAFQNRQIDGFAPSALYLLAAPSTPDAAREEALSRAEAGEPITFGAAREIVAEYKAPAEPLPFEPSNFTPDYSDPYGDDEPELWEPAAPAPQVIEPRSTADHQRINLSTNNEWYTPAQFIEAARTVMGQIDLDPASCAYANRTVKAERFYTAEDDGFTQPWRGRVWMNPPYGREEGETDSNQARWTRRLIDEYQAGNVTEAVILVNAVPGNRWFAPLKSFPICFPDFRIRFYNEQTEAGQPTHSNALVYLGPDVARFVEVFSQFGMVMGPLIADSGTYRVNL